MEEKSQVMKPSYSERTPLKATAEEGKQDKPQPSHPNQHDNHEGMASGYMLLLSFVGMVFFGLGNRILSKLATVPMVRLIGAQLPLVFVSFSLKLQYVVQGNKSSYSFRTQLTNPWLMSSSPVCAYLVLLYLLLLL